MRIGRTIGFSAKLISKRVLAIFPVSSVALGGALVAGYLLMSQKQVFALTPPDSCFTFDRVTGTINDYGDGPFGGPTGLHTLGACPAAVDIPAQIDNAPVLAIADHSFQSKGITAVTFPDTLTVIGDQSFADNQISGGIIIPDSVTTIVHGAFAFNMITSVTLGTSVQLIGDQSFVHNRIGGTVTLPDSVTTIEWGAFANNNIEAVTFGTGLTSIGGVAFGTNQITSLTIPSNITVIEQRAFEINQLTSVDFGRVVSIGDNAFAGNRLTSIDFPDTLETIGGSAFRDNLLTSVSFPDSLQSIGDAAFSHNSLTALSLPSSLQFIGVDAFIVNQIDTVFISGNTNDGATSRLAPSLYANRLTQAQLDVFDVSDVRYVAVYTADPSNPFGYVDEVYPYDANGDGTPDLIGGGAVINPAQVTVRYVDSQGNAVHPAQTTVGPTLSDYLMMSNQDGIQAGEYYVGGQSLTVTPVAVSGYVTPSAQSPRLVPGANTVTFVYYTQAEAEAMRIPQPEVSSVSATSIKVAWTQATEAVSYRIQYRIKGATAWTVAGTVDAPATSYAILGLLSNTEYEIQIVAIQPDATEVPGVVLNAQTSATPADSTLSYTGSDRLLVLTFAIVLVAASGLALYMSKKRSYTR